MQIYSWNCEIYLFIAFSFFNPASPALAQHACISKHLPASFLLLFSLSLALFPPISSNLRLLQFLLPQSTRPELLLLSELRSLLVRYSSVLPLTSRTCWPQITYSTYLLSCSLLLLGVILYIGNTAMLARITFYLLNERKKMFFLHFITMLICHFVQ